MLEVTRGDGEGDLAAAAARRWSRSPRPSSSRRLLRPALRLVERLARGRSLGLRIASLSLARNPGYAVAATAFLVVSFGLALFAESYRATLARGERDQAAHRVPLDYVVREDLRRLIPVQDAAPLDRFGALPGVEATPVLRLTGGVGRLEGETGITLLGIDAGELAASERLARQRGAGVAAGAGAPDRGGRRPRTARGSAGRCGRASPASGTVRLFAEIEGADGALLRVALGEPLPAEARGGRLAGIAIEPDTRLQERGADAGQALHGSVTIELPDVPGGDHGLGRRRRRDDRRLDRPTTRSRTRSRRGSGRSQPTEPLPVLATPRLERRRGRRAALLPLQIAGERLTVRVVGTIGRFPGVDGQAVVGDGEALAAAVNLARPGRGPRERGLAAPP